MSTVLSRWEAKLAFRQKLRDHAAARVTYWRERYHAATPGTWERRRAYVMLKARKVVLALRERQVRRAERVVKRHLHDQWVPQFGLDWAWGSIPVATLKAQGVRFTCRYLSRDKSKNLTHAEARAHSAAGIANVVVWETTANRALSGFKNGAQDAREALGQARECGIAPGAPIYFAVDFDMTTTLSEAHLDHLASKAHAAGPQFAPMTDAQALAVADYFRGVHSVLDFAGPAGMPRPIPVGVYGGIGVVEYLLDRRLVKYAWQTYAWSGGKWDPRAQLHQYSNGHTIVGVGCDFNLAVKPDFGQWTTS